MLLDDCECHYFLFKTVNTFISLQRGWAVVLFFKRKTSSVQEFDPDYSPLQRTA